MTRTDHLLWILAEECNEVAQRASKAARFGLSEIQHGQELTNAQRIMQEMADLTSVTDILIEEGILEIDKNYEPDIIAKKQKIEKFLKYSEERGTLSLE